MDMDWDAFKGDVSMKQLINTIDRSIKRRNRLLIAEDEEGSKLFEDTRLKIQKWRPLKLLALTLYVLLPFFEKPGWCIQNSEIHTDTSEGFWYCQNKERTISNSHIPKLPVLATNLIYIFCLAIIFFFTKIRDNYRKRDEKGDTVTI